MNRVNLVGRLTAKPELVATENGVSYTKFRIAVNRTFSNAQGEREADFINILAWRKQAENACLYLNKGSLISVEGRIQTGSYTDKDGNRKYLFDVVADSIQFLESKNKTQETEPQSSYPTQTSYQQNVSPYDFHNQSKEYIDDTVELDDNFLD